MSIHLSLGLVFAVSGTVDPAEVVFIEETDVPGRICLILEAALFFLSLGPFAFKFSQAWNPVKHRALVGMISSQFWEPVLGAFLFRFDKI